MIPNTKLDFWIKNNYNVILRGRHGVGKTACIKAAFESAGLKWKYFSASTMDPWVDFIGVPREVKTADKSYLDLVLPKSFADDDVHALFFDEFNRSPAKIRNAVMELIQFKSINGRQFKNLKIVWAAINPDDKNDKEEFNYNVEPLDPAQLDRFHIIYDVPYDVDKSYFRAKYTAKIANPAIEWWYGLDQKIKLTISPRRLDYALDAYTKKGDLRDILPSESNVKKLITDIEEGSIVEMLKALYKSTNEEDIQKFFADENKTVNSIKHIAGVPAYIDRFVKYLPSEHLVKAIAQYPSVLKSITSDEAKYTDLVQTIISTNGDPRVVSSLAANTKHWKFQAKPDKSSVTATAVADVTTPSTDALNTAVACVGFTTEEVNRIKKAIGTSLGLATTGLNGLHGILDKSNNTLWGSGNITTQVRCAARYVCSYIGSLSSYSDYAAVISFLQTHAYRVQLATLRGLHNGGFEPMIKAMLRTMERSSDPAVVTLYQTFIRSLLYPTNYPERKIASWLGL